MKGKTGMRPKLDVIPVPAGSEDYHGCGYAWAAIDQAGKLVALRYMDSLTLSSKNESFATFDRRRTKALAELAPLGRVVSGMLSCWELVLNFEPENNPDLLNPAHPLEVLQGGKAGRC
jgi:hypothetical protein